MRRENGFASRQHPLGLRVPSLGRMLRRVQVALRADLVAAIGERQEPAHGKRCSLTVVASQRGTVDEVDAPLPFNMGATTATIVRVGVGVTADPKVRGARMGLKVPFKRLGIRLVVHKVQVGRAFRRSLLGKITVVVPHPASVGPFLESFPRPGGHGRFPQHVVAGRENDRIGIGFDLFLPPREPTARPVVAATMCLRKDRRLGILFLSLGIVA